MIAGEHLASAARITAITLSVLQLPVASQDFHIKVIAGI
jgi:hypothetical protein